MVAVCQCHVDFTQMSPCSRMKSRVVRKTLDKSLYKVYRERKLPIPPTCHLHPQNDPFANNEAQKYLGSSNRWECGYCGKAFVAEHFLDMHYDNRHTDTILKGPSTVCLADYCDIFRCDVINHRGSHDYWLTALCMEDDMRQLTNYCLDLVQLCIAPSTDQNTTDIIKQSFNESVCSYLTCEKYWETPTQNDDEMSRVLYVIWSVFVLFSIIIYYFLTCTHFLSDESLWNQRSQELGASDTLNQPNYVSPHRAYQSVQRRHVTVT